MTEGFTLTALLDRPTVTPGQPVRLILTLDNCTAEVRRLPDSYPELDYDLVVLGGRGDQLAPMEYGTSVASSRLREAQPGEALAYTYELNDMYDISALGDYRITASRWVPRSEGEGGARVASNAVVLRVCSQP